MFDSLDEQMKHDEALKSTPRERMLKWVLISLASVVLFGLLYFAIRMLN